jgi:hypothetical protein
VAFGAAQAAQNRGRSHILTVPAGVPDRMQNCLWFERLESPRRGNAGGKSRGKSIAWSVSAKTAAIRGPNDAPPRHPDFGPDFDPDYAMHEISPVCGGLNHSGRRAVRPG